MSEGAGSQSGIPGWLQWVLLLLGIPIVFAIGSNTLPGPRMSRFERTFTRVLQSSHKTAKDATRTVDAATVAGARSGRVLAIDDAAGTIAVSRLQTTLSRATSARSPEEVKSIALVTIQRKQTGTYKQKDSSGSIPAYQCDVDVWLVDAEKHVATAHSFFKGTPPPDSVTVYRSGGGSHTGNESCPDGKDIARWIENLPVREIL
jgi:hypothetical protein